MKRNLAYLFYALIAITTIFLWGEPVYSQQLSKSFTVNDGLPSNLVYGMVQDDKGFLWIGTDNGVARFDGKYFKVFTTDDGLPDNEILEVRKENDGTIWVNTFKQGPCYFDEKLNRFVDPLKDVNINKDFIKMVLHVRVLQEGGIVFYSGENELVFKNRKYVKLPYKVAFSYPDGNSRAYLYSELKIKEKIQNYVYYKKDNKKDSVLLYTTNKDDHYNVVFLSESKLYILSRHTFFIVSYNDATSKFEINNIKIKEDLLWFRLTDKHINISTLIGHVYVYNLKGLFEHYAIEENYFINSILEDNEKNIWVGTLNKGLQLYKINHIELYDTKKEIDDNFLSVAAGKNDKIYAGNYYGEILEINKNGTQNILRPFGKKRQVWVRKILLSGNKVFALSENSIVVDFKRKVYFENIILGRMKGMDALNDSIIIAGGLNPDGALFKINTKTEKATLLNSGLIRISKVECYKGRYVYCATNEGLFKYDYEANHIINSFANTPLDSERILEIETTDDGLVIVATSTKGIYILKDDKIIQELNNDLLINSAITDIVATPNHTFWMSTRNGLSKVSYTLKGNKFEYSTNNFSSTEGLPANVLSGVAYRNDTVFLATEKGVAFMPEHIKHVSASIRTFLTDIKINHVSVPLNANNQYELNYSQRSMWLEFSGVGLGGHLKKIQYTLNKEKGWSDLDATGLSLELNAGKHTLYVRGVDINGGNNNPELVIKFNVAEPFYLNPWTLTLVAGLIAGLIVLVYYHLKVAKQKREWANELRVEQERNRITADLHDEIRSSISSLQVYSEIAFNLVDKNKEEAKKILKKISGNSSKISESISDIIWSMKPNEEFTLSPAARIKNIASEVLGTTDVKYEISIDPNIEKQMTCIICRKNLILIVKEAINNILKYSRATYVSIQLKAAGDKAVLTIKDNGVGMNVEECIKKGNGLGNMNRRAKEIGGHFTITSSENNGTTIQVNFLGNKK